jgi:predicted AAA+ superfamily ATPase
MESVFEEWKVYAEKKELKERDIDFNSVISNSTLKIIPITGIRRSGKTSVLILLYQALIHKERKVGYINLEDSRINSDKQVLDNILRWFGDEGYLLLDEITSAYDYEGWLARNHEMLKGKLNIIVSSSRRNLVVPNKPLRGRLLPYELYPLSFKEFLRFNKIPVELTTAGIGKIEKALNEYLLYGGFPEAVLLPEKTEKVRLLNSYFKDIIGLDVAEIAKENISTVGLFGKYVLNSSYFSASKCLNFFKSVGYKIAKQSLLYLEKYSQEGYLFFFIPIFSHTLKDKTQYPRKAYAGDTGFLYAITGKTDWGRLYENAIYLELKRKLSKNEEINYWKNKSGQEVDFVIRRGIQTKEIIQSSFDMADAKTRDREIDAVVKCAKECRIKKALILTKQQDEKVSLEGISIRIMPLWKWFLGY